MTMIKTTNLNRQFLRCFVLATMLVLAPLWVSAQTFTDVIKLQGAKGIDGEYHVWDASCEISIKGAHDVRLVKEKVEMEYSNGRINGVLSDSTYILKKWYDATVYDGEKVIVKARWLSLDGPHFEDKKNDAPFYLGASVRIDTYDDQGRSNDFNRKYRIWGEGYPSVSDTLYASLNRHGYQEDSLRTEGEVYFRNSGQGGGFYGRISRDNPDPEFLPGVPYNTWFCVPEVEAVIKLHIYPNPNGNIDEDEEEEEEEEDDDEEYYEEEDYAVNRAGFWDYAIPIGVAAVLLGGGAAAVALGKKKKNKNKNKNKSDKSGDRLAMRIYKEFRDTIIPGRGKYPVYARIVRIPAGSTQEVPDERLTAMIDIKGDDYLKLSGQRMENGWKRVDVEAPEQPNLPEKATVTFSLTSDKGAYVNHVHFHIEAGEVLFGQDNLTLPSGYKKEVRLPFVVVGRDGDKDIKASIVPDNESETRLKGIYDVKVEWSEKDRMHYAVIRDLKQDDPLDKKPSADVAGKYESFRLEVEAPNKFGQPIKGSLVFFRYHMGLALKVGDIGCYIEEYDRLKHRTNKFAAVGEGGKTFVPAETKSSAILYEYDEQNHKILQLAPIITDYHIEAIEKGEKQVLVEKIGLQCDVTAEAGKDGGRLVVFRCCKATLDAPSRIEAKIMLTAKHEGREYKLEKKVLLCSQPVRHFTSMEAEMAALKEDKRIGDILIHIQTAIYQQGLYNRLFPLEKFINVMLDGYDAAYGYDPKQVKRVRDLYVGVLSGRIEGANGEGGKPLTLADEVNLFLTAFLENSKKVEESLGFFGRMAVGVCTLGCSEVVFTGLEVVNNMKEYVDNGGDSVWGGFCVGAKVVVREYITEKLMTKGMEKMSQVAKEAGLTPDALKKAAKEMAEEGKGYLTTLKGKVMKNAINESEQAARTAAIKGQALSRAVAAKPLTQAERELLKASEFGLAHAKEQVRDLRAAIDLYRMNPHGAGNQELVNKLILEVQQNKQAMYILKKGDSSLNYVRSKFNTTLEKIYEATDDAVMDKLSKGTGVPRHKIKKLNATTSEKMKLIKGEKVTMDRDVTYYWTDENGVDHYFSQKNTTALYNNEFHEKALGYRSKVEGGAGRFAQAMDQTNIEDVMNHPESYGWDLDNMLKPELHKQALLNPDKVADTVTYKGKEWLQKGNMLLERAKGVTDLTERQLMQSNGVSSIMEGLRQEVKQFDNFVNPRNLARRDINGMSKIPEKLRIAVDKARKVTDMDSSKALVQVKRELEALGYTLESFAEAMGQAIRDIG